MAALATLWDGNRPQVQFEQNDFAVEFRRQHRSPSFATARPSGGNLLVWANSPWNRLVGNRYLHPAPPKVRTLRRLDPGRGDAKLPALSGESHRFAPSRARTGRRRRRGRNAPNAQAKGLTRRLLNQAFLTGERRCGRRPGSRRRDRPPKGQAGPYTGAAISQVKRTARALSRPYDQGGTDCPRRNNNVR